LGQKIEVNTPAGVRELICRKMPKQAQQLRLKDKGIPNKTAGHLYLILNIVLPTTTAEQQQAYELCQAFSSLSHRVHKELNDAYYSLS
jgi:curved DNA-binding protein